MYETIHNVVKKVYETTITLSFFCTEIFDVIIFFRTKYSQISPKALTLEVAKSCWILLLLQVGVLTNSFVLKKLPKMR